MPAKLPKRVVAVLAMVPAVVIGYRFFCGQLGANPIERAMNQLGLWTLALLLASLVCTPLKVVFHWKWPLKVRKMLGLCAFFYVCLHLCVYVALDQGFSWDEIYKDVVKRKFITVGFLSFLILTALAVTSPNRIVKRMGFAPWKRLHRLVYLAAAAGVVHFIWRVKADLLEPLIYAGVLALLLGVRVVAFVRQRARVAAAHAD